MNNEHPLWLPKGSVRALLAIGIVTCDIVLRILDVNPNALGALDALAGSVVTFYFKERGQ